MIEHGTLAGYRYHRRKAKETPCYPCRDAMKQHWKQQRVLRNDDINKLRREWRMRTPGGNRRGRRYKGEVGEYSDIELLTLYGTDCHICGEAIDLDAPRQCGKPGWERAYHVDHVIPLSKGGSDELDNVRPAHGQCNIIKSATIMENNA